MASPTNTGALKAIILAAGFGRRLDQGLPKCLTPLAGTISILDMQLSHLLAFTTDIHVVVGFRKELVTARYAGCVFVDNDRFATTNTAVSLALGLESTGNSDVLLINGDVVFEKDVLRRVLSEPSSGMAAKRGAMAEEEMKYRTDADRRIIALSKALMPAEGEAVGINFVCAADVPLLRSALKICGAQDYFEKGFETAIAAGMNVFERDVSDLQCIEVDFPADLEMARKILPVCLPAALAS
jgi:choline kinase